MNIEIKDKYLPVEGRVLWSARGGLVCGHLKQRK